MADLHRGSRRAGGNSAVSSRGYSQSKYGELDRIAKSVSMLLVLLMCLGDCEKA